MAEDTFPGGRDPETGRLLPGHKIPGGGRPRKVRGPIAGPVTQAFDEAVQLEDGGKRIRRTKRQLAAIHVVNKAANGKDPRAAKLAFDLEARERAAMPGSSGSPMEPEELTEDDQKIVGRLIERLRLIALEKPS